MQREVMTSIQRMAARHGCVAGAVLAVAAMLAAPLAAHAQFAGDPVKELAAPPSAQLPLKPNPGFAQFPRYVGMLGNRQIVLRLGAKTDDPQGVHGEYQYTDTGEVLVVAGDRDGSTLEIEESNDGTHIVGNWVGTFAADGSVAGDRMNIDDSNPQPFELKPLAAGQAVPPASVMPVAANPQPAVPPQQTQQAAPSAKAGQGGQPVGGVSNLTTGD
ncbi:hypothetical protein [Paraburkholderia caballeronis]|uniref:hypothetical protein n=1 Tax=Paraburkholderia caballeronis TaxID=416943 RepID=UPI0010661BB3|nr:hypothetical protein [Paraburkholderia caballeronis]